MNREETRVKEALNLIHMADLAIANYNLETGFDGNEISLNNEITLDTIDLSGENTVAYAVTKFSIVTTKGEHIKFLRLDIDDIYTLQDIIHDEYDIDYVTE